MNPIPTSPVKTVATLALAAGLALAESASGALLAYEGFEAGDSNASGEYTAEPGGGSGRHYLAPGQDPALSGFSGSWDNSASQFELGTTGGTQIDSPAYPGATSSGNAAFRQFNTGISSRELSTGLVGADGTTAYFSFLMKLDDATSQGRLEFSEGNLSAPGGGIRVRADGSDFIASAGFNNSTLAATDTSTHLFVWRLDFGATDSYTLYMDPTDLVSEGGNTPIFTGSGTNIDPTYLTLERNGGGTTGNGVIFDEIHITTAWGSALFNAPVPEPSTFALLFIGGSMLSLCRKKSRA